MKKINKTLLLLILLNPRLLLAAEFREKIAVYGVIKPGAMTTLLAINHGILAEINYPLGTEVKSGDTVVTIIERETNRPYKTYLKGVVAKVHVHSGAAVTAGMPMITVLDPLSKIIEVSLSPQDGERIKVGTLVLKRGEDKIFGKVSRISPLVDPDTGAVLSFVEPVTTLANFAGDVVALDLVLRTISDCVIVPIHEIEKYISNHTIVAVSGSEACLKPGQIKN